MYCSSFINPYMNPFGCYGGCGNNSFYRMMEAGIAGNIIGNMFGNLAVNIAGLFRPQRQQQISQPCYPDFVMPNYFPANVSIFNNYNYNNYYYPNNNWQNEIPIQNQTPTINYLNIFNNAYDSYLETSQTKANASAAKPSAAATKSPSAPASTRQSATSSAPSSAKIVDNGKQDINFLNKVKQVAQNLNCDYKDLLAIINSESSCNPQAGRGTNYVGLVQFGKSAIQDLRTKGGYPDLTKEKILNMTAIQQLDLVEKMININKGYAGFAANERLSGGDLYALIFAPSRAKREVMYSKGEAGYNSINSKMDYNNDGKITKSELSERVRRKHVDESRFTSVA